MNFNFEIYNFSGWEIDMFWTFHIYRLAKNIFTFYLLFVYNF